MPKLTVEEINAKYADEPEWDVTVHCDDHPDFTCTLRAPREGLARTNAMFLYPHPLAGQMITYTVTETGA